MIIKENIKINDKDFIKTYSDQKLIIRKVNTNEEYGEALDLAQYPCEYEETYKVISSDNEVTT